MAAFLSELLGAREPLFSITIKQLEDVTARQGVDVRLISEIIGTVHEKMKIMGLDPRDTRGLELYHSLCNIARDHDDHLSRTIGITKVHDVVSTLPKVKSAIDNLDMTRSAWVIKKSAAKRLLRAMPPRTIMKHLGYASVDSMIKREKAAEIFSAMRFAEPAAWLDEFIALYRDLTPQDFETRAIEVYVMPKERWAALAEPTVRRNGHVVSHLKELGVVTLLPMTVEYWQGITLTTLPLALHYMNEIRFYSAYFKLQQVKLQFGQLLAKAISQDVTHLASMTGEKVHWRVVHRHFARHKGRHPDIFEPHVQPEDLFWRKAEEYVYVIDPELGFWRDLDYVGIVKEGKPLSFNLIDAAQCYATAVTYPHRLYKHFRQALWNELYVRYLNERILEEQVLHQLDTRLSSAATFKF